MFVKGIQQKEKATWTKWAQESAAKTIPIIYKEGKAHPESSYVLEQGSWGEVESPSLETFKIWLAMALSNLI